MTINNLSFNPTAHAYDVLSRSGGVDANGIRQLQDATSKCTSAAKDLCDMISRMGLEEGQDSNGRPRGSRSGGSWLQAIAKVLGQIADQKANELQAAADAIGGGGNNPSALTDFQVKAQEFSLLMNTITGALKSLGEGISAPAQASAR
jgi:hypothetical protein